MRYAPPPVDEFTYPIAAVPHNTPKEPQGVLVMPDVYQARLTVGPRVYRQPIVLKMDPRVKTTRADLQLQFKLSRSVEAAIRDTAAARKDVRTRLAAAGAGRGVPAAVRARRARCGRRPPARFVSDAPGRGRAAHGGRRGRGQRCLAASGHRHCGLSRPAVARTLDPGVRLASTSDAHGYLPRRLSDHAVRPDLRNRPHPHLLGDDLVPLRVRRHLRRAARVGIGRTRAASAQAADHADARKGGRAVGALRAEHSDRARGSS